MKIVITGANGYIAQNIIKNFKTNKNMKVENRGGMRQGSGRKSKAHEQKLIEKLDNVIEEYEVLETLKQLIINGDLRAVQLYFNYRYGKPKDSVDLNTSGEGLGVSFKELITAIKKKEQIISFYHIMPKKKEIDDNSNWQNDSLFEVVIDPNK